MPSPERVRELCAKLGTALSGPEFDRISRELLDAIDEYTRTEISDLIRQLYAEKDADKKVAMVEKLKEMLDDPHGSDPARAS